ncbi:tRNA (adenine(22)-N(1))-methyltransferase TrmK [Streptomyces sp. CHA1]|uniref:SAM-dependent methyltransferase n=1 Tax=Streptomyces TaxID=1883 RepID=UPI001BFCB34E|nr:MULTISPECIES: class I SAM-dependent methyltransferase [unclassified Streptomyces]MBT3161263.1 tRNA (adenine(22)-N(1))-methyltransferase TrmK [Streptomyces sp. G11C]MCO6704264.1 tRNA (adenine(22)-N(1))-methyltransferase TrmK [Streptomyces sp. CHB9.2]MCO6710537.1 tRNA (adenine(22)-N(1))-methyltransferase TrmK [Streptomyces sp. CHA3]MCO6716333.1 tRNA (adenine(22)-N(1))-methyltransferase TrmK [Streptomyces sp. CHB19.2]MCO6722463.1 tRNA (adenine(22)-N(1))-methyltransferase TrmK [Streptomyces sp.
MAELLNGFIGTYVLYSLIRTGVLDLLYDEPGAEQGGAVPVARLAAATGTDPEVLVPLLGSADRIGLVAHDPDRAVASLTARGRHAYRVRGYFTATVGGFGDVFRSLDSLALGRDSFENGTLQDGHLTALGCAQNWTFQKPLFDEATADLEFSHVADIGCGAATRLIHLVESRPGTTGIGIDMNTEACQLARQNVKRAGLDDRITIVQADMLDIVTNPEAYPQVAEADLVTSYFILHHFVGGETGGRPFLTAFREAFPAARHVVVADGFTEEQGERAPVSPLFTLAYELFHDVMGIGLQTHAAQRRHFTDAGFTIIREVEFGHPLEWLFVLGSPREEE